jgi:glycosyltransferase involved in cell wall biosynthesis
MRPITVVIPTRNRSDTLYWSIKSCIAQDYDNLTILVSDNCSEDNTHDVVHSFSDSRIKYVKPPEPTSMAGNVEFALSQCVESEGFVTVFGDDDGLVPGSLQHANGLLDAHPDAGALTWSISTYNWPNCLVESWRNTIYINVSQCCQMMESLDMLKRLTDYTVYYHHLPGLWTSLLPFSALRECRKQAGRFIISGIPDAGSAVSMACIIPRYLYSERPVTMLGSSAHSNGLSTGLAKTSVINRFYGEATIPPHKDLIKNHSGVYYTTESLLWARDRGLLPKGITIDLRKALECMLIRGHSSVASFDQSFEHTIDAVRQTAALHSIQMDFTPKLAPAPQTPVLFRDPIITTHEDRISMFCNPSLISNIYEAVVLAHHLIAGRDQGAFVTNSQLTERTAKWNEKLAKSKQHLEKIQTKLDKKTAALNESRKSWLQKLMSKLRR